MLCNTGEVRKVGIQVINKLKQNFIIDTADYEIRKDSGEIIATGYATVEDHTVYTLFTASDPGVFHCTFTYRIVNEILKATIYIQVS